MANESFYYSKKITVTDTQQKVVLPRLRGLQVLNYGNDNVYLEPENDISDESIIIPVGSQFKVDGDFLDIRVKTVNVGQTATLYIFGLKHSKS